MTYKLPLNFEEEKIASPWKWRKKLEKHLIEHTKEYTYNEESILGTWKQRAKSVRSPQRHQGEGQGKFIDYWIVEVLMHDTLFEIVLLLAEMEPWIDIDG